MTFEIKKVQMYMYFNQEYKIYTLSKNGVTNIQKNTCDQLELTVKCAFHCRKKVHDSDEVTMTSFVIPG